ncbi:hypothetical protein PSQ19_01490 [Devosia algicola]|uniref:ABC transmembrane type-1 domain-containing protein n=1 Tax=Devosia algicola TaxID=3026418 RepID=A0ABY7YNT1_9HYPH|nr:hypothetical protein [Devosia algicola]WDR02926.1 hypothetical protein PSQ19_01490 [Devosia algicola]
MATIQSGVESRPVFGLIALARGQIIVLFALSVTSNILMLTGSVFMLQVYDRVLPSRSTDTLIALTTLVIVLYGFYALIEWIRARMAIRLGGLIHDRFAQSLFQAAVRLRLVSTQAGRVNPIHDLDVLRAFISGPGPIGSARSALDSHICNGRVHAASLAWRVYIGGGVLIAGLLVINEPAFASPGQCNHGRRHRARWPDQRCGNER